jgi:hypothetical protein
MTPSPNPCRRSAYTTGPSFRRWRVTASPRRGSSRQRSGGQRRTRLVRNEMPQLDPSDRAARRTAILSHRAQSAAAALEPAAPRERLGHLACRANERQGWGAALPCCPAVFVLVIRATGHAAYERRQQELSNLKPTCARRCAANPPAARRIPHHHRLCHQRPVRAMAISDRSGDEPGAHRTGR